jgi:hypothetical protein
MKAFHCYGDPNISSCIPGSGTRYARWERWPGILLQHTGEEYKVIEEDLPVRTTVWKDPLDSYHFNLSKDEQWRLAVANIELDSIGRCGE